MFGIIFNRIIEFSKDQPDIGFYVAYESINFIFLGSYAEAGIEGDRQNQCDQSDIKKDFRKIEIFKDGSVSLHGLAGYLSINDIIATDNLD